MNNIIEVGSEKMEKYWDERSKTYSELIVSQMENGKRHKWEDMILRYAPKKDTFKILDVGTGPGFFAIILAQKGHHVSAVDYSAGMIEQAKSNAEKYEATVDFKLLTEERLPFADESFDLVISRNVTWTLRNPEQTLKEWRRVTKKEGKVLYFDANWYYYLFNEKEKEAHKINEKQILDNGGFIYEKADMMEQSAYTLPLSKEYRPDWDLENLPRYGFSKVEALKDINHIIYTEEERLRYESKPSFLVVAER